MADEILYEQWAAEVSRVFQVDDGLTAKEIAAQAGKSKRTILKMLQTGVAEGRYTMGTAPRMNACGRMAPVPVYRVVKKRKGM
jgi:predicted transcriptional regulator